MAEQSLPAAVVQLPGAGPIRARIQAASGRVFGVRGATLYERLRTTDDTTWESRGQLSTTMGEVELHENAAATRLLVRDALQTYAYGYETQAFNVIQTAPRIRVRWQYAPALGPAVAFRVYRQVGSAPFVKIAELPAVEPGVQIYTYLDGQIQPGVIYVYYVVAVTASGEESAATPPMAVEVPRSVQAPQSATAVYVAGT